MTSPTEQYTEIVKQSQDAVKSAVETWTKTVQDTFGQLPAAAPVDPNQVIDQVFDFASKLLSAQRDFAKHLVATTAAAADSVRQGAVKTTEAASQN